MEIFEAILLSLLIGLASQVTYMIYDAVIRICTRVIVVGQQAQVSTLDRFLAETGWCSSRYLGPGRMPANGTHFAFLRGPFIAVRTSREGHRTSTESHSYLIYAFGQAAETAIATKLMGNPRDVILRYVYAPAAWRTTSVVQRSAPPGKAYRWQTKAVAMLMADYCQRQRTAAIVCGPPGVGKSTLGELLAVALQERFAVAPEVIKNADLTSKGLLLEDTYDTPTVNSPVILMLDEFDSTISHAERTLDKSDNREGSSLADSATSLLGILDRLNATPFLIVIATTNRSATEMRSAPFTRYTRKGRFDHLITAEESAKQNGRN